MTQQDYYQILGVNENADAETIKEAFRQQALKYHPDRNRGNPNAAERMKSINEAYAVLSDPHKREQYNILRSQFGSNAHTRFRNVYTEQDIFRGSDVNAILEEMARAFGVRGFEDLFKEFYGQSFRTFEFGKPGFSAKGFVFTGPFGNRDQKPFSPKTAFQKNIANVSRFFLKKMTGIEMPQNGADLHDVIHVGPEMAEKGGPFAYDHRKKEKKLVVKIPPKVRDGQRIRLAGMGKEGKGGAKAGDLYLKVRIRKPLLKRILAYLPSLRK